MSMTVGFSPIAPVQTPAPSRPAQRQEIEDRVTPLEKIREAARSGEQQDQNTPLKVGGGNGDDSAATRQSGSRVDIWA
jgi:hypothetical protein